MNFQSYRFERILFATVLFFFVLPPIFISASNEDSFVTWNFPLAQITHASFAATIILLGKKTDSTNNIVPINSTSKMPRWLRCFFISVAAFVALCAVASFFEFIAKKLNVTTSQIILLPKNIEQFFFCVTTYFCAAFYEEEIYRFYLPEMIYKFFLQSAVAKAEKSQSTQNISAKAISPIIELVPIMLFAMAHRYLGIFALVNSIFAAIILRVCFLKTRSILPCVMAHGLYNLLMLFLFAR